MDNGNTERDNRPFIEDPKVFIEMYRESQLYKGAYDTFFADKILSDEVTAAEKTAAFEQSENARAAFFRFSQTEAQFHYNSDKYTPDLQKAVSNYLDSAREMKKMERDSNVTRDEMITVDQIRSSCHTKAADRLTIDLAFDHQISVPRSLSRGIVTLIAIEKHVETPQTIPSSTFNRAAYALGAKK